MEDKVCFSSCFAQFLQNFVKEKQDLGYKYETEYRILRHFDRYCMLHCSTPVLCQELVQGYISMNQNRTAHTKRNIIGLMRQFAFYLIRNGHHAWVFPKELLPKEEQIYKPYIFTRGEISLILEKAGKIHPNQRFPTRHLTLPLLYRTLYCCGLRVSEATGLTLGTVNLKNGILFIKEAKDYRDRIIPLSGSLTDRYREYHDLTHKHSTQDDFFFRSDCGKRYSTAALEKNFREILWECGISYGGRRKGPHLHDVRHTFSVHCLQNAMNTGHDIQEFLPVLSSYLGHKTLDGTQRYLHLTAELYPDIREKLEEYSRGIISGGVSNE